MSFGDKLKTMRIKHKLSLAKLGKEIGVTKATIWQWESMVSNPDNIKTKNMDALCKFFNIPKKHFFSKNQIQESTADYNESEKPVFTDMLSRAIIYVLDNHQSLSNEDVAVAIRLLYNKVKDSGIILGSDLEEVLQLLK